MLVIMDERLIHAQILYHWCKAESIEEIWLLSLKTMEDPFKKLLMDAMMPASIKLQWVGGLEDLVLRYDQCSHKDKVLIVVETLKDLYHSVENCSEATGILSNMLARKDRTKTNLGLYMTRDEADFAERMLAYNDRYRYQPLPDFEPQCLTENNLRYEEVPHEHVVFTLNDRSSDT